MGKEERIRKDNRVMDSNREGFYYLKRRRISKIILLKLIFIITIFSFTPLFHAEDKTKTLIGGVEEVVLFPWGVKLTARIDTGASMTSLDVRNLTIKNRIAHFKLPEKYGNTLISLPVIRHSDIRSPEARERRPVVEIEICIGGKRLRVHANLNDRSRVEYPIILGRNVLNQGFIVDSSQEKILPPKCLEGSLQ